MRSLLSFLTFRKHTTIKAILVDVGGVLVKTHDINGRLVWEKKLGLQPGRLTKEVYLVEPASQATTGLVKSDQIWRDIQKKFSLTPPELNGLITDFYSGDRLNNQLCEYIRSKLSRYKTAIFSNAWNDARGIYSQKFHLDTIFDTMIISAEVGMKKPDPKFYHYALDLLGVLPEETILLDDEEQNILAANGLGMKGIIFTDTQNAIDAIEALL